MERRQHIHELMRDMKKFVGVVESGTSSYDRAVQLYDELGEHQDHILSLSSDSLQFRYQQALDAAEQLKCSVSEDNAYSAVDALEYLYRDLRLADIDILVEEIDPEITVIGKPLAGLEMAIKQSQRKPNEERRHCTTLKIEYRDEVQRLKLTNYGYNDPDFHLLHEYEVLSHLEDVEGVPCAHALYTCGLVEDPSDRGSYAMRLEFVPGKDLEQMYVDDRLHELPLHFNSRIMNLKRDIEDYYDIVLPFDLRGDNIVVHRKTKEPWFIDMMWAIDISEMSDKHRRKLSRSRTKRLRSLLQRYNL